MYLFLAIPNYCGSTLIHSLLETVPEITSLTLPPEIRYENDELDGFVEGNICATEGGYYNLRGPYSIEANMEHVYSNPDNYDWELIKQQWDKNWKSNKLKSNAYIKLQKTPTDIFRIKNMLEHFENIKWIISVRNPYSYIESILRKAVFQIDPIRQLDQICYHVGRTLEIQRDNCILLGDSAYTVKYEDFTSNTTYHVEQLGNWLPELKNINLDAEILVKGHKINKIYCDTDERITRLREYAPNMIEQINEHLLPFMESMDYWEYPILLD